MQFLLALAILVSGGTEIEDGVATHYHYTYGWDGVPHVAIPKFRYTPRTAKDASAIHALRRMPMLINLCNKKSNDCIVVLGVDFCGCGGSPRKGDERIADMSNTVVEKLGLDWGLGVYKTTLSTTFSANTLRDLNKIFIPAKGATISEWKSVTYAGR
jgi:hypothetical protein